MTVETMISGPVATITLDRPGGNRIDFAMRRDLHEAVLQVSRSDARVLLLRGAGRDFCRGGDVREWVGVPSGELGPKIAVLREALDALGALPIPTVAVVQGACHGGGFEIALACDFILAAQDAVFAFPEAASGLLTLQGGALSLAERTGASKALELVLLCAPITAVELAAWRVVNQVTDVRALDEAANASAEALSKVSPQVVAATKALFRTARTHGVPAAMADWYAASMPLFDRTDTQAALRRAADNREKEKA